LEVNPDTVFQNAPLQVAYHPDNGSTLYDIGPSTLLLTPDHVMDLATTGSHLAVHIHGAPGTYIINMTFNFNQTNGYIDFSDFTLGDHLANWELITEYSSGSGNDTQGCIFFVDKIKDSPIKAPVSLTYPWHFSAFNIVNCYGWCVTATYYTSLSAKSKRQKLLQESKKERLLLKEKQQHEQQIEVMQDVMQRLKLLEESKILMIDDHSKEDRSVPPSKTPPLKKIWG